MMADKQSEAKRASCVSFQGPAAMMRPAQTSNAGQLLTIDADQRRQQVAGSGPLERRVSQLPAGKENEITVCHITGDWGLYQWSVCLFAVCYSALAAVTVVLGPILTPDMQFKCAQTNSNFDQQTGTLLVATSGSHLANSSQHQQQQQQQQRQQECFKIEESAGERLPRACQTFLYDDQQVGLTLTNGFNLVCERDWLRSLVSSAALGGMLISSVTLGVFSDKFGRLRCIQLGFLIGICANAYAIITRDYFLFCGCILLMSYAQIGAANALCTLLMEVTSPRFRFVPVFEYGLGWGLGVLLVPLLHAQTLNYRYFMAGLLAGQLALLPWLHLAIFESIRWLLSEGHFNRAQIELRRVCRFNRVRQNGAQLAQEIAGIQAQQVRKASRVFERQEAPRQLARALGTRVDETARELDMLSAAIRKSFFGIEDNEAENSAGAIVGGSEAEVASKRAQAAQEAAKAVLSPTLSRLSFSVSQPVESVPHSQAAPFASASAQENARGKSARTRNQLESMLANNLERRDSFTTQGLIQLAVKYSRAVEKQQSGSLFIVQMFHPRLWRSSVILMCISIMYETSYYGLIQANKFVGESVALNYVVGALGDWSGALVSMLMLILCSRKFSLISTTLLGAAVCFALAASYHMIPEHPVKLATSLPAQAVHLTSNGQLELGNKTALLDKQQALKFAAISEPLIDNDANLEPISSVELLLEQMALNKENNDNNKSDTTSSALEREHQRLLALREQINFYLIGLGKFVISVGIQVAATIAMEVYPNNLRQSGPGAILFMGRIGSIAAPFLFNDSSQDKLMFKLTLVVMSVVGLLVCVFVPACIRDSKGKELLDQMNEMDDDDDDDDDGRQGKEVNGLENGDGRRSRKISYLVQANM